MGENGGVAGLNFYSAFLRERRGETDGRRASVDDIADHALWMIKKAGEDAVANGERILTALIRIPFRTAYRESRISGKYGMR